MQYLFFLFLLFSVFLSGCNKHQDVNADDLLITCENITDRNGEGNDRKTPRVTKLKFIADPKGVSVKTFYRNENEYYETYYTNKPDETSVLPLTEGPETHHKKMYYRKNSIEINFGEEDNSPTFSNYNKYVLNLRSKTIYHDYHITPNPAYIGTVEGTCEF